jgi:hypothetical protein
MVDFSEMVGHHSLILTDQGLMVLQVRVVQLSPFQPVVEESGAVFEFTDPPLQGAFESLDRVRDHFLDFPVIGHRLRPQEDDPDDHSDRRDQAQDGYIFNPFR